MKQVGLLFLGYVFLVVMSYLLLPSLIDCDSSFSALNSMTLLLHFIFIISTIVVARKSIKNKDIVFVVNSLMASLYLGGLYIILRTALLYSHC